MYAQREPLELYVLVNTVHVWSSDGYLQKSWHGCKATSQQTATILYGLSCCKLI